ncbi:hypothetical protein WJX84_001389 [Apatococcus fuscideae]|uniref:Uncharacterized protein n=1 Tax=Apatococcus fuscideae TaxID=2026836 RepID=A0AAW1SVR2_9CHLO
MYVGLWVAASPKAKSASPSARKWNSPVVYAFFKSTGAAAAEPAAASPAAPIAAATLCCCQFEVRTALFFTLLHRHRKGKQTQDFFLTARNSIGVWFIGWSFYAAVLGSWAVFSIPSYAYTAGYMGLIFYSVFSGVPILIQAYLGIAIQKRLPMVTSFTDFVQRRFGTPVMMWVALIMMLNMGIALTAEMTAIGDLFTQVVGTTRVPIVIIIAVTTAVYTAAGGLYISILTDQVQAVLSLVLLFVAYIYVAATFREPLGPLPAELGTGNYTGMASIATMPISLICASIFSEVAWARCWASASNKTLKLGALFGTLQIIVVCFLLGFAGLLAAWSGLFIPTGPDDYGNTIFFTLFLNSQREQVVWITVIVGLLAITLSTSNQDSLQNGLVECVGGVFLKNAPVWITRVLVVILTVPCLVVSLQSYNIISLYLLGNLVTTTHTLPIIAGLIPGKWAERIVTPFTAIFGCWVGFAAVVVYAALRRHSWGLSLSAALHQVFFEIYDWPPFVIALIASVAAVAAGAVFEMAVRACLKRPIPPSNLALAEQEHRREQEAATTKLTSNSEEMDPKLASSQVPQWITMEAPPSSKLQHEAL